MKVNQNVIIQCVCVTEFKVNLCQVVSLCFLQFHYHSDSSNTFGSDLVYLCTSVYVCKPLIKVDNGFNILWLFLSRQLLQNRNLHKYSFIHSFLFWNATIVGTLIMGEWFVQLFTRLLSSLLACAAFQRHLCEDSWQENRNTDSNISQEYQS